MYTNKSLENVHLDGSPFVVIAVTTLAVIVISIYCLLSGWNTIFQNLFYIPIIIACVYYIKKGFAFSVVISFIYLFLIIAFTRDFAVIMQALIRVVIFIGVAGTITFLSIKRQKAEDKIKEQKRFLEVVLESLTYPFYVIDVKDYTIKMANLAAGFADLSKGSTCYALTHKRDRPCTEEHVCPLKEVMKTKKPIKVEHIHYDKNGNVIYVEVHGDPIFDSEGNVVQMIEYAIDITERKRAEEENIKHMQELEVFYKASVGREERILELKKELDGLKRKLGVEDSIAKKNIEEQAPESAMNLKESLKSREILSSMLADNNQIRGRLEKSLEKLKEAHVQLIYAEKMEAVGRMASGVAHEVKNPLGIILQGINYFEGALPPEEKDNREMLQMMKDSLKRADNIVRALLDFARAGELKTEQQNINTIVEAAINLVQHKLKLNSIEYVCELGKDLPEVAMDKGKIEQVFINLFDNAADAMPKGGKLYVRSYLSGEGAIIVEVEDTGTGIDKDIINKIFDPFFTTKNRTEGTGLGLSVAKSIIEMHKALINVESKNGKGTKFTIVLKIL